MLRQTNLICLLATAFLLVTVSAQRYAVLSHPFFPDIDPLDSLDHPIDLLSKSMRQLSTFADKLADPSQDNTCAKQEFKKVQRDNGDIDHHLILQPRFQIQETQDGLILVGSTPGLRKEDLSVEVVDTPDGKVLEVSGHSQEQPLLPQSKDRTKKETDKANKADKADKADTTSGGRAVESTKKPAPKLTSSYVRFERKTLLPRYIDPDSLQAKYKDGLLVVRLSRKTEKQMDAARRKYAIEE